MIKNKYVGVIGLRAFMCNPNADFDGYPRVIGGRHCMSPMSIKYTIKDYWHNNGMTVRRIKGGDTDNTKGTKDYIDVVTFGMVGDKHFSECKQEKGLSVKGAVQFSDAICLTDSNTETQKVTMSGGKIGDRHIVDEGHYFSAFYINQFATKSYGNNNIQKIDYTDKHFKNLIEGAIFGASNLNGYSKTGLDNEFLMLVKLKEGSNFYINQFNHLIKVEKKESFKVDIDLQKVMDYLSTLLKQIEEIKIYYNTLFVNKIIAPNIPKDKECIVKLLTFSEYLKEVNLNGSTNYKI